MRTTTCDRCEQDITGKEHEIPPYDLCYACYALFRMWILDPIMYLGSGGTTLPVIPDDPVEQEKGLEEQYEVAQAKGW